MTQERDRIRSNIAALMAETMTTRSPRQILTVGGRRSCSRRPLSSAGWQWRSCSWPDEAVAGARGASRRAQFA